MNYHYYHRTKRKEGSEIPDVHGEDQVLRLRRRPTGPLRRQGPAGEADRPEGGGAGGCRDASPDVPVADLAAEEEQGGEHPRAQVPPPGRSHTILYYTIPYHTIISYTIMYHIILYYTILY